MDYINFKINAFTTNDIDAIPVESGYCHLDSYYEKPWVDTQSNVIIHDNTYDKDVTQGDMLYTNGFPSEVVLYEDIDKTKYYWDTLHQELYFYDITEDVNPWYTPVGRYKAVEGDPPMVVNIHIEFDQDALYFDKTQESTDIYAWNKEVKWYVVGRVQNIDVDPATEFEYDIDTLDKEIYYYNTSEDEIWAFDYGVYFKNVEFTGTIHEKMFEFYERLHDNFLDYSNTTRVNHKDFIYVGKHPSKKVTSPIKGKVYFDTSKNKMYVWDGTSWQELVQENVLIPHTIFY